jgi:peptidoglycan/LPS O-acetylase OafA/YrhL
VFHTLDGLRGVAALCVALRHCDAFFAPLKLPSGYLAVDLFFGLSGFVIAHAYHVRLEGGMSFGRFLWIRLVRLYPLYILGILFGLLDVAVGRMHGGWATWSPADLTAAGLAALFLLPSPVAPGMPNPYLYPFNLPAWSLFFELLINAVYALVWRFLSTRVLVGILAVSAIVLTRIGLEAGHLNSGWAWNSLDAGLARVSYSFFAGILLYRLLRDRPRSSHNALTCVLLGALAALFAVDPGEHRALFDILCVLVVFPALLALGARSEPGPRAAALFGFLGAVSYAVYALHFPLFHLAQAALRSLSLDPGTLTPWIGWTFLAALVLGCWLIDRFYDGPVRRSLLAWPPRFAPSRP